MKRKGAMDERSKHVGNSHGKSARLPTGPTSNTSRSITERISTSAAGLARDTLLRPTAASATQAMAALATNVDKGESSSSTAGSAESLSTFESSSSCPSSADSSSKPVVPEIAEESFRSHSSVHNGHAVDRAPFDFDAFLSGQDPPMFDNLPVKGQDDEHLSFTDQHTREYQEFSEIFRVKQQGFWDHATISPLQESHQSFGATQHGFWDHAASPSLLYGSSSANERVEAGNSGSAHDATETESHPVDGAAVVALLSDPAFTADDEPVDGSPKAARRQSKPQDSDSYYAEYKKPVGARLRMVDHKMTLVPNFALSRSDPKAIADAIPRAEEQARIADLKPWFDILDSYQDEVWGEFLPLVQQVRKELCTAKAGEDTLDDKPAVRRLRMLLGHLEP